MCEDELVKFESKWREIYSEGIEKLFRIADAKEAVSFDVKQYTKLYT
jgi:hypothetical protein